MKNYEFTVVLHPDLEMNPDPALDKVKKIITNHGGKILKEENDGKKRLAYTIKGQAFGLYYFFDVALPAEAPNKISTNFNISDEILRHLIVKADGKKTASPEAQETSDASTTNQNEEKGE